MTARCCRPSGVNVHMVFAVVFAIGAGLAGFAGVVGGTALSIAPGRGRALSARVAGGRHCRRHGLDHRAPRSARLLIGLAEQIGLVYLPTYGIVLTFIIMVATLAFRPQGIMGRARPASAAILPRPAQQGAARAGSSSAVGRSCLPWRFCSIRWSRPVLHLPDRRLVADPGA